MKKIVIFGAGGQLGRELSEIYKNALKVYHHPSATGIEVELSDLESPRRIINENEPDIVINAAALANVDLCEKDHTLAYTVNGESVNAMVKACRKVGSVFVHVSTDYVFDGYDGMYTEKSAPNPINYYGLSKLVGDIFALSYENSVVVRTSGVYGYSRNFPLFVLNKLMKNEEVNAIEGYYSPIHAANLAIAISKILNTELKGLMNIAGERVSRFEFARKIAEKFGLDRTLINERKEVLDMNAKRPYDSSLDSSFVAANIDFDFYSIDSNLESMKNRLPKEGGH